MDDDTDSVEVARLALAFLKRVPLKGEEVPAFVRVWNMIDRMGDADNVS